MPAGLRFMRFGCTTTLLMILVVQAALLYLLHIPMNFFSFILSTFITMTLMSFFRPQRSEPPPRPDVADLMIHFWERGDRRSAVFFATARACFHVAAADGHISQEEIDSIEGFYRRHGASPMFLALVQKDLEYFTRNPDIDSVCRVIRSGASSHSEILFIFGVVVMVAGADNVLHPREKEALFDVGTRLGLSRDTIDETLKTSFGFGSRTTSGGGSYAGREGYAGRGRASTPPVDLLAQQYRTLGLEPGASLEEVKQAYRKMAKQYHPDAVAHLGKEFQKMAQDKFKTIQKAYEMLRKELETAG